MAALPAIAKVLKTILISSVGGNPTIQNTVHCQYSGSAPTLGELNAYNQTTFDYWFTNFKPHLSVDDEFLHAKTIDLSVAGSAEVEYAGNSPGTRAATYTVLPPTNCLLFNFGIDNRYRGGHPRWYQSGIAETEVDEAGLIAATAVNGYGTAMQTFLNSMKGNTWTNGGTVTPGTVSYYQGHTWAQDHLGNYHRMPKLRSTPLFWPTVSVTVNPLMAGQSRRSPYTV